MRFIDKTNRYALNENDIRQDDLETIIAMGNTVAPYMCNEFSFRYDRRTTERLNEAKKIVRAALKKAAA